MRAGATGLTRAQITHSMERLADADQIEEQLKQWQAAQKVDSYTLRGGRGRPKTVWRATTLLGEEYGDSSEEDENATLQ